MDETLLLCLRWDAEGERRLRSLAADDWLALQKRLAAGRGEHFLTRRLQRTGIMAPDSVQKSLRARGLTIAAINLRRRSLLKEIIDRVGRPVLLLKGVELADRLYGSLAARLIGDVDILVRPEDLRAYDAALLALGFSGSAPLSDGLTAIAHHHHLVYTRRDAIIELHWRLDNKGTVDLDGIWSRASPSALLGRDAYVMGADDLLLYLCLHLREHTFETPLTQLWDLAELLHAPALPLDWANIWRLAEAWHLGETIKIALYLLHQRLGVETSHLSNWQPDAELEGALPDPVANLGRFPYSNGVAGHRVAVLLDRRSAMRDRISALRTSVFMPRAEIRLLYGNANDGLWGDGRSYLRRITDLVRRKGSVVADVMAGKSAVQRHVARVAALRRHLDESEAQADAHADLDI